MRGLFGHDFSRVRVHTSDAARRSTARLDAAAYTVADDIVWGAQPVVPESLTGRRLLAHELAHVVQQERGSGQSAAPTNERAAEQAGTAAAAGAPFPVANSSQPIVQQRVQSVGNAGFEDNVLAWNDPHFVDRVIEVARCTPIKADRYTIGWPGGEKLIFNDDIDFSPGVRALPLVGIYGSQAAAKAAAAERQDLATLGHYDRAVAYYKGPGGVILPTWFTPETAPETIALLQAVRHKVREVAATVEGLMRGQRNAMVIGALIGGVLRVVVRLVPFLRGGSPQVPEPEPRRTRTPPQEQGRDWAPAEPPKPVDEATVKRPTKRADITPKAPPPAPIAAHEVLEPQLRVYKDQGFVFEGISRDGRVAVYRNPTTGQRLRITLRQAGPQWLDPSWGRPRIVEEMRKRGFGQPQPTEGAGGLMYENSATGERIRIMPRPKGDPYSNDEIEKRLTRYYYRYRPGPREQEGRHSAIVDKPDFTPDK